LLIGGGCEQGFIYLIYSTFNLIQISKQSFIEYCQLKGKWNIMEGCILSGIKTTKEEEYYVPKDCILIGLCLSKTKHVTIPFHKKDDLNRVGKALKWMSTEIGNEEETSLWNCALFPLKESAEESVKATLKMLKQSNEENEAMISVRDAILNADIEEMLEQRRQLGPSSLPLL